MPWAPAPRLTKGNRGLLGEAPEPRDVDRPRRWNSKGVLAAWEVQLIGQLGRRKPKVQSRDEQDAVPFDDPLRF
jgi:hypothetical protein